MKKLKEGIPSVKDTFSVELSKLPMDSAKENPTEFAMANQEMKSGLSEKIIKRPSKKGMVDKLVGKLKMKTPIGKLYSIGKSESKEATGAGAGVGSYDTPLFTTTKGEMEEKWSQKYKDSIDCNNPKGFSQRAHCQGKKKKQVSEEKLKGGKADNKTFQDLVNKNKRKGKDITVVEKELNNQLNKGMKVEMEHTKDKQRAKEIAMDHLFEDPKYYDKLEKIETKESLGSHLGKVAFKDSDFVRKSLKEKPKKTETKEATGASSAGAYVTTAAWAKSTKKKDWRGKSKTQIPGGKFVQVKEKCKKFPYCNQGDINALNIFENETLKKVITKISEKHNISENTIKRIIYQEYQKKISNK